MKFRHGFVSNSSSNSFIVIGKRGLTFHDVFDDAEELIRQGRLYAIEPYYCSEGMDVFQVTPEIWAEIHNYNYLFEFIDAVMMLKDGGEIKKADIEGDKFNVFPIDISYHYTKSVDDFHERYMR